MVPVRLGSRRLPAKALSIIGDKALIVHVWERLRALRDRVDVATDDARIAECLASVGASVIRTSAAPRNGTERVALVADPHADIIVNVQGDQPFVDATVVADVAQWLHARASFDMATVAAPLLTSSAWQSPDVVKVVVSGERALYFSRAPIPAQGASSTALSAWRHLGIYAWRFDALKRYAELPPSPLERLEHLEQLRALEAGMAIGVMKISRGWLSVDTTEDLIEAREIVKHGAPLESGRA